MLPELKKSSEFPFISIIDEVVSKVVVDKIDCIGLLGTPSIIKYNLYQKELIKHNVETVIPAKKEQIILEKIIRNILKGEEKMEDQKNLVKIADALKERGAEGIVLGCTELPLLFPLKYKLPVYNAIEILAKALLRSYYK